MQRPGDWQRQHPIHGREVQEKIFSFFASRRRRPRSASATCSSAFEYGAPPMGGFAHGLDRIVALLAGERDIREVIAFPKTKSARDPMTGAPSRPPKTSYASSISSTSASKKRPRPRPSRV